MNNEKALAVAIKLAIDAHQGQKDKRGEPYILHPLNVMLLAGKYGATIDERNMYRIIGVLHDIIEDTDYTVDQIFDILRQHTSGRTAF